MEARLKVYKPAAELWRCNDWENVWDEKYWIYVKWREPFAAIRGQVSRQSMSRPRFYPDALKIFTKFLEILEFKGNAKDIFHHHSVPCPSLSLLPATFHLNSNINWFSRVEKWLNDIPLIHQRQTYCRCGVKLKYAESGVKLSRST